EAEPYLRRALAIAERDFGPDHPQALMPLANLGAVLHSLGQFEEAETYLGRALRIAREAQEGSNVVKVLVSSITAQAKAGRLEEAQQSLDRLFGLECLDPTWTAVAAYRLGRAYAAAGRPHDAAASYQAALDAAIAAHGPDHPEVATDLAALTGALADAGRLEEAQQSLDRLLTLPSTDPARTAGVAHRLG
ncbi:Tetratricopeptide repeat-containing protein, partial [Geodermatophilus obscurus]